MKAYKYILLFFGMVLLSVSFIYCGNNKTNNDKTGNNLSAKPNSEGFVDTSITRYLDTAIDQELTDFLDSFELRNDTTSSNIVFDKKKIEFSNYAYNEIRNATGDEAGIVLPLSNLYKTILPFTDNQKKYFDLMSGLSKEAVYLANKNNFHYPRIDSIKPEQFGLAYSWGSKSFQQRINPPGEKDTCKYEIYGLDCSGFIYQLFRQNAITLPLGTANEQRRIGTLQKALFSYFDSNTTYDVVDLGKLPLTEIKTGDIIYFQNRAGSVTHIGICLKDEDDNILFYEASGSPNSCDENLSPNKGVRALTLNKKFETDRRTYSVVRITIPGI